MTTPIDEMAVDVARDGDVKCIQISGRYGAIAVSWAMSADEAAKLRDALAEAIDRPLESTPKFVRSHT